ncbi:MAG TPA: MupA/Atu3671 family FMN-dependent luciferase-like monooxygenase [Kofleriaceae bacterium]|nr:MupA/Atu3671 family FMN-dependent luciferase-like monooxygenase [Kofleriaceae bacterium]
MKYGLMFFGGHCASGRDRYRLVLEAARFADDHGFAAVWTPERHFDDFGGIFPNPSLLGAALAVITRRVQIRAGSLIAPLHDPVRIAEDWSVVDNLSSGRVAISFGSGWNVNDFIFFPDRYANRRSIMFEQIDLVQRLWRGDPVVRTNSYGKQVDIALRPRPFQAALPFWVTSSGNPETFAAAGEIGANVLTHMIGQDLAALRSKIETYRAARAAHGHAGPGVVTLMLHTFLGEDLERVRAEVYQPFREYLRAAVALETRAASGGGAISGGHKVPAHDIPPDMLEELLDLTFERYFQTAALMGTSESCRETVERFREAGVDEIACLIDFGVDPDSVLASLVHLHRLQETTAAAGHH